MRWKAIAGNVLAVLLAGLLSWLVVRGQVSDALERDVAPSVERGVDLFEAMRTAEGEQFKTLVATGAERADVRAVFALGTASERNQAAFQLAQAYGRELGSSFPPRRPREADIVALANAEGRVLARNVDPNQDRDRNLRAEYEAVDQALAGTGNVTRDYLKYDQQKWYDVAVAPVRSEGRVVGLLIVGYEIGDSVAREESQRLGADVGYLIRDGNRFILESLSFGAQGDKEALLNWLNGEGNAAQVLASDSRGPARELTISGDTWRASLRAMPSVIRPTRQGAVRPGFIVMRNATAARAPAGSTTVPILIFTGFGLLLVLGYNVYLANYMLRPIEQIEEGLLRIINGDRDFRIELQHAELGGIIYRVNQLVSELTGAEEETDEAGRISRPPPPRPAPAAPAAQAVDTTPPIIDDSAIATFNPQGNPADAGLLQQLSAEPEHAYFERLHREYLTARQQAGRGPDGQTMEQFIEMVRAAEQMLSQAHSLTSVRFQVSAQGDQVVFRAIPIR